MEFENELRKKIHAFLREEIADLEINYAEGKGEISLLLEKCRSGDIEDLEAMMRDLRDAALHKGYRDGIIKMAKGIANLIIE